jgi:hypothetical protein
MNLNKLILSTKLNSFNRYFSWNEWFTLTNNNPCGARGTVRRVLLYVLQTHSPVSLIFHMRWNKSTSFGARIEAFGASTANRWQTASRIRKRVVVCHPSNRSISPSGACGACKAAFWHGPFREPPECYNREANRAFFAFVPEINLFQMVFTVQSRRTDIS